MNKFLMTLLVACSVGVSAYANMDQTSKSGATSAAGVVSNDNRGYVISFKAGSSDLSEADKAALRTRVESLKSSGQIEKAHIAAWADKPFPKGKNDLARADRNLADSRIEKINSFLKDNLDLGNTDTFNMAEKSNWLARAFETNDAELKSLFGEKLDSPVRSEDFQLIKKHGQPSKAVVIFRMEGPLESK